VWFGTDHFVCRNNFNLLWALPSHTVAAFFLRKPGGWMHYYLLATIILQAALLIGWIFIPQELNLAILPIILLVLLRSWLLILKPHAYANNKMG
jgi:thiol:disulfide interchange protein